MILFPVIEHQIARTHFEIFCIPTILEYITAVMLATISSEKWRTQDMSVSYDVCNISSLVSCWRKNQSFR
jgi:hypothetical protein